MAVGKVTSLDCRRRQIDKVSPWAFVRPDIARGRGLGLSVVEEGQLIRALDPGIQEIVRILREGGVETHESCEGGPGHSFFEPTVRFYGNQAEGFRAFGWARIRGLYVAELRRFWAIEDGEPTGPHWEMTFALEIGA